MMNITLNGKKTELEKPLSLMELLSIKGLDPQKVVIEYNFQVLGKEEWGSTILKENDNLEVLRFVGGG